MLQERIVAFVDILGFSQMIKDYEAGEETLLGALQEALNKGISLFDKDSTLVEHEVIKNWKKHIEYRSFSDCICVTIPVEGIGLSVIESLKLFVQFLGVFQVSMLQIGNGYLLRGGLSVGRFHIDKNMIFSLALIEAYEMESKKAVVPRILVGNKILDLINKEINTNQDLITGYPLLTRFEDEHMFINFLNHDLKDVEATNTLVERISNSLGGIGNIYNGFEEISLGEKKQTIDAVLLKVNEKLRTNKFSQDVINKYQWLIRFLTRELELKKSDKPAF